MFARPSKLWESMQSTSSFAEEAELESRPPDPVPNLLSELWQEMVLKLAELRMSLLFLPIQPEGRAVAEVEDSEQRISHHAALASSKAEVTEQFWTLAASHVFVNGA